MSWRSYRGARGRDGYGGFAEYVPVAVRRAKAAEHGRNMAAKGAPLSPVAIEGRTIAHTFWGKAWCDNLESYSDYANRLPRGRTYVRNGSVLHLDIRQGAIEALVSGSSLYKIKIGIAPVAPATWKSLRKECSGEIGSLVELLSGTLSDRVMGVMTKRGGGLFPSPQEIKLSCSCPDWAEMCKHVAAVLYGVGARLDQSPELLFLLRHVDHTELVAEAAAVSALTDRAAASGGVILDSAEIGEVFGIEMVQDPAAAPAVSPAPATRGAAPAAAGESAGKSSPGKPRARRRKVAGPAKAARKPRRKKPAKRRGGKA